MMDTAVDISGYVYGDSELNRSHTYLVPPLLNILSSRSLPPEKRRVFELGCGNGAVAAVLTEQGYRMTGVEVSTQGLEQARRRYPYLSLQP